MHNMRGIIDPLTLGFLISLIGSSTAYLATNTESQPSSNAMKETAAAAIDVTERKIARGNVQ